MQRHWTQSTLAAQLNTTRMTIVRWEQGTSSPGLYFREQLCKLFGMSEPDLGLDQQPLEDQPPRTWLVPEERNLFFTGREVALQQLHLGFQGDRASLPCAVQILSGLAGVGKTQVALEYAYQFREYYAAVAWLRAETPESLLADLTKLASALRLHGIHEQDEAQMMQALREWLETTSNWLLILDNVEELALVSRLLPSSTYGGSVLITTRMQATGRLGCQLTLAEMDAEEGALLLLRRAKLLPLQLDLAKAPASQRVRAVELCQELGGLPLALDQAGAYIEETGCSLAGYLERFQRRCSVLLAWRGRHASGYPFSMTTTVLLARERVERCSPVAFEILCLCLFFHPGAMPEQLITRGAHHMGERVQRAVADLLSLDEAFALLNSSSLLRRDPETHLLSMHRLVQNVLRDQLAEDMQRLWAERALQTLQNLFPGNLPHEMVAWPLCELLLPHIVRCVEHIERLSWGERQEQMRSAGATLLLRAAAYLLERARYQEAELCLKRALDLSTAGDEPAYLGTATALYALALLYEKLGRYSEAETLAQQVLFIQKQKLTENDPHIVNTLNTLAQLYGRRGKYAEAEQFARQALHCCQQASGADDPDIAGVLNTLAQLAIWTGKYQMATIWAARALHMLEKNVGTEHPSVAAVIHTLAIASWEQGEYKQAGELFQRIFVIWEQALGAEHPFIGYPLHNRAQLCKVQGEYAEAEALFQRVLQLWENTLGPHHPERAEPLKNLGEVYLLQQRYDEAQRTVQRALEIYRQSFGPEHPQMAVPLSILGTIAMEQGDYERADRFYQQAYRLCGQFLDGEHPHMAQVFYGQARLALKLHRDGQARQLLQQALAIRVRKLGMMHPDTQLTRELYQSIL